MLDESIKAGMEIKNEDGTPIFENQYMDQSTQKEDTPTSVFLTRTPQGLVADKENGQEISNIFEILQPGDNVNHQTVVEVKPNGVVLDYFGSITELNDEKEIFSVLIKDEIEQWKKDISEADMNIMFEDLLHPTFYKVLELICNNINMEKVNLLYPLTPSAMDERYNAIIGMTVKKSLIDTQKDLNGANVIVLGLNYNPVAIEMAKEDIRGRNGNYLYTIAIQNPNGEKINEGDIVIC